VFWDRLEVWPMEGSKQQSKSKRGLFLPLVPYNAAIAGLGTLVPLAILALRGTVIDVSLAAVAYNLALIPAPLIWGYVCDVTGSRKKILMLSAAIIAASSVGMYFTDSIPAIIFFYAAIAHATGMLAPALNLLIIESVPKGEWDEGYTRSSWYSTVGTIAGLGVGMAWSFSLPSLTFLAACAAFAFGSVALTACYVRDPPMSIERRTFLLNPLAFVNRLAQLPLMFVRVPKKADFTSMIKMTREELTRDIPVIVLSSVLFSASLNIFFTSYTPYLKENQLTNWEVYFTSLYIAAMNGLASRVILRRMRGTVTVQIASSALAVRALGMLLAAFFAIFVSGYLTLYSTLLSFTLLGVAYTVITINLNSLFFKALPAGRQGGLLGVYSAFNGIALFAGSLSSGYVSFYLGYPMTFFLGALLVFLSAAVLQAHFGGTPQSSYE
jgi:MFS family permease